jgi:hypothetical protein
MSEWWCPDFVPFSCYGVVDAEFNRCDICRCRREDHPVATHERADTLHAGYPCGLDGIHSFRNGSAVCDCGGSPNLAAALASLPHQET